ASEGGAAGAGDVEVPGDGVAVRTIGNVTLSSRSALARAAPPLALEPGARPLLKWAGGKRQLLPALRRFYPAEFGRYFEPFLGSGAVFFDLLTSGGLSGHRVFLTDSNRDLIGCYETVRDAPDEVIRHLEQLAAERPPNPQSNFLESRTGV